MNNRVLSAAAFVVRFLAVPATILLAYILIVGTPGQSAVSLANQELVLFIAIALGAMLSIDIYRNRGMDTFSPTLIFSVCIFLGYLLPLRSFGLGTDDFSIYYPFPFPSRSDAIHRALLEVLLGVAAFAAGYFAATRRGFPQHPRPFRSWSAPRLRLIAVVFTILGVGLFGMGVVAIGGVGEFIAALHDRTRGLSGLNYYFASISLLGVVTLLWLCHILRERQRIRLGFLLYFAASIVAVSLLGSKGTTLIVLLAAAALFHYIRAALPLPALVAFALCATLAFGVYDLFIREYLAVGAVVSLPQGKTELETAQFIVDRMVALNFIELENMAVLQDAVPTVLPIQRGTTYLALLSAPIPRALWPGKFEPSTGIYTQALWPSQFNQGTTMPAGIMGELYMNFESIGVGLGMLLFGWFYGVLYRLARRDGTANFNLMLYCVFSASMVHYIRGESYGPTVNLLVFLLPLYAAWVWVSDPGVAAH